MELTTEIAENTERRTPRRGIVMRKFTGGDIVLISIGLLFLLFAIRDIPNYSNVSVAVGSFLPGLFFLILGLKGRVDQKPEDNAAGENQEKEISEPKG